MPDGFGCFIVGVSGKVLEWRQGHVFFFDGECGAVLIIAHNLIKSGLQTEKSI